MFTGIIEELGEVVALDWQGDNHDAGVLRVRGPRVTSDAAPGDSIAVSGVCLTVVAVQGDEFTADVMRETFVRSALGSLKPEDPVNLERAATPHTRLGGHLVQGHVDGVGTLVSMTPGTNWTDVRIALPTAEHGPAEPGTGGHGTGGPGPAGHGSGLDRYLVEKGSICVDGISLTVVDVDPAGFSVSLIPTTLELTTLGRKQPGAPVNLEVDVIAKYVEKLIPGGSRT